MIITKKKDPNNILETVKKYNSFFLIGCSECASLCGTGNDEALDEMAEFLESNGKKVTGKLVPKTGCQTLGTKIELKKDKEAWKNYQRFSASYKRIRIAYINSARKRPEEFEKRLSNFIKKTKEKKLIGYGGIEKYY